MQKRTNLFNSFIRQFAPPVFDGDEEKTRIARVLNATLLTYYGILTLAGIAAFTIFLNKFSSLIIIGCSFLFIVFLRRLMCRGFVRLAGILGTIIQWILFTVIVAVSGAMTSVSTVFYLAGTVMAGLMLGPMAAGLFALASIFAGLVMTILTMTGHPLPRLFPNPALSGLIDLALALFLATLAVNINLVSLKKALKQAHSELHERRIAETELGLSEKRYRALFETADYPIILLDSATRKIIDANAASSLLYGYTHQEFTKLRMEDLAHTSDKSEMADFHSNNSTYFGIHQKKDGSNFPSEMTGGAFWLDQHKVLVAFIKDISGRLQRETEMEAIIAIGAAMRHAPNRVELVNIILQQLKEMLDASGVALLVQDAYTQEIIVESACGEFTPTIGKRIISHLPLQSLGAGRQLTSANILNPTVCLLAELMIMEAAPIVDCNLMINQSEIQGILVVGHAKTMTAEQYRLLATISEISASALVRTTLFDAKTIYARQMTIASEMSLMLAQTLDLSVLYSKASTYILDMFSGVDAIIVSLFDAEKQMFSCIYAKIDGVETDVTAIPQLPIEPPGHGMQSQAVHRKRPVIIADLQGYRKKLQQSMIIGDETRLTQSALYVPMLAKDTVLGVVNLQSYSLNRFSVNDADLLTLVSNTFAVAIENARLFSGLQQSNLELSTAYDKTIAGWSHALDLRDMETEGHSQRVADLAVRLGYFFKLTEKEIVHLRRGALLHDIGKIGIPDGILLKPSGLTATEWDLMRMHPVYAYEMLKPIEFLQDAMAVPYAHHEKWDGSGYPRQLKGEEIPFAARIFAVVDVFDALTSDRPYRAKLSREETLHIIQEGSGKHFDPDVVDAFLALIKENPPSGELG